MTEPTKEDRIREMIWLDGQIEESPDEAPHLEALAEAKRVARLSRRVAAVARR